ncbi:MAG: hypothetical protein ACK5MW_06440 [Enterococcus sp.]
MYVDLKLRTGDALLMIAAFIVLLNVLLTHQPWWGVILSIVAILLAFSGGVLKEKEQK